MTRIMIMMIKGKVIFIKLDSYLIVTGHTNIVCPVVRSQITYFLTVKTQNNHI